MRRVRTIARGDRSLERQRCTLLLQRLLCRSRNDRISIAHSEPNWGRFRSYRSHDLARGRATRAPRSLARRWP